MKLYQDMRKLIDKLNNSDQMDFYPAAARLLNAYGFRKLGEGATRSAYGNGKVVIKVGHYDDNLDDYRSWKRIDSHKVWKWAAVPMIEHIGKKDDYCSFLIAAQAKPFKTLNSNMAFPNDGCRILGKKEYQRQWEAIDKQWDDAHDDNIGLFGNAVCLFDFNFAINGFSNRLAKEWIKWVDMNSHQKKYKAELKAAIMSLSRVKRKPRK